MIESPDDLANPESAERIRRSIAMLSPSAAKRRAAQTSGEAVELGSSEGEAFIGGP